MFSVALNIITIILVAIFGLYLYTISKKTPEIQQDTPTDVFQELINGDRINEILNEPVPRLMAGPYGTFVPNDSQKTPMYLIT